MRRRLRTSRATAGAVNTALTPHPPQRATRPVKATAEPATATFPASRLQRSL